MKRTALMIVALVATLCSCVHDARLHYHDQITDAKQPATTQPG